MKVVPSEVESMKGHESLSALNGRAAHVITPAP
jgi:hypothetical protein